MISLIKETNQSGDTVGGEITGVALNVPVGWGCLLYTSPSPRDQA